MMAANRTAEAKKEAAAADAIDNPFKGFLNPAENVFTMEDLKGKWPKGIKGDKKEWYLSDAEFESVLKMTKAEWGAMKTWKQEGKKKDVGLF